MAKGVKGDTKPRHLPWICTKSRCFIFCSFFAFSLAAVGGRTWLRGQMWAAVHGAGNRKRMKRCGSV